MLYRSPQKFVVTRRGNWERLDALLNRINRRRVTDLTDEELQELGALYRGAAADLARAQTRFGETPAARNLIRSLTALVLRAHAQVYATARPHAGNFTGFLRYGFPAACRRQWRILALAGVLLTLPAVLAYFTVLAEPARVGWFVPDAFVQGLREKARHPKTGPADWDILLQSPQFASAIMINNILVSMRAVAMGLTFGVGTLVVLVYNGLMLGALAGMATSEHVALQFWSLIVPHGVLELPAIAIAGGAGLLLAQALFAPGDLPRRDALRLQGLEAARLMAGVAFLLVIAGTIEGFLTPAPLPPWFKIWFAVLASIGLVLYLVTPTPSTVELE